MSIHKRAKDMGVSDLVKKLEELEEENKKLREDVEYRYHRCMVAERWWEDDN